MGRLSPRGQRYVLGRLADTRAELMALPGPWRGPLCCLLGQPAPLCATAGAPQEVRGWSVPSPQGSLPNGDPCPFQRPPVELGLGL